jgi:hypothetical protein
VVQFGVLQEMRVLSKLRHPNVTTVMGAVMPDAVRRIEPLLVMELMVPPSPPTTHTRTRTHRQQTGCR